ncbi:MAG: NAD(P)/FAD-dependent oxidoreductase [Negativicutes bacterium]|nr:NAD(P)/FAD-dependent oxidoreductase [Negativicutes bacterium]
MRTAPAEYDAVIVGAGPAGCCAAGRLAEAGLKVLLVERKARIGENIQCAEFVPRFLEKYISLRDADIAQAVTGIKTFIHGELANVLRAPGYTLNRGAWERSLADEATRAGARVLTGVRVADAGFGTVTLITGDRRVAVTAKYILGCDGPSSLISRKLGNQPAESCVALQYELPLAKPLDHACLYFDPVYYGGYGWVFPKGLAANVGMAVHPCAARNLPDLLARFRQELVDAGVVRDNALRGPTGGLIPAAGLAEKLASDHMLVAGDAAGCTHPVTGAGIISAVVSGQLAAAAVTAQGKVGSASLADSYPRALTAEYGPQFARARSRLIARDQGWTYGRQEFVRLIRRSWIAFPEYYTV